MYNTNAGVMVFFSLCALSAQAKTPSFPVEQMLVFSVRSTQGTGIYRASLAKPIPERLTPEGMRANWPVPSPDGKTIAFQRWQNDQIDIWTMTVDGREHTELIAEPDHDYLPTWMSDGKSLVYLRWQIYQGETERRSRYWQYDFASRQSHLLGTFNQSTSAPVVESPQGDALIFTHQHQDGSRALYRWLLTDTQPAIWLRENRQISTPVFSIDGKTLYFAASEIEGDSKIYARDLDSGNERMLYGQTPAWYPSLCGEWLVATTQRGAEESSGYRITMIHLASGHTEFADFGQHSLVEARCLPK